jgi:hypothetical protein
MEDIRDEITESLLKSIEEADILSVKQEHVLAYKDFMEALVDENEMVS